MRRRGIPRQGREADRPVSTLGRDCHFCQRPPALESPWVDVAIQLTAGDKDCVGCEARIAVPETPEANPWSLKGEDWKP